MKHFAKQLAWQEALTQLLVTSTSKGSFTSQHSNVSYDLNSANQSADSKDFEGFYVSGADEVRPSAAESSIQVSYTALRITTI